MELEDYMKRQQQRHEMAHSIYPKLVQAARGMSLRRVTYRCRKRCLLLDAIQTPEGIVVHQKRYKLSKEQNLATSSASGRAANTSDGNNHWVPRTYFIDVSALGFRDAAMGTLRVQCDHTVVELTPSEFWRDWDLRHDVLLPR